MAILTLLLGYGFGIVNHRMTLPLIWFYQDPTLFSRDVIPAVAPHFSIYFYKAIAWLVPSELLIEQIFFIGWFISAGLSCWLMAKMSVDLNENETVPFYTALIFALGYEVCQAGATLHDRYFGHVCLSIPFILSSIYLLMKKRYEWSVVLTGLLFYIHGMYAVQLSFCLMAVLLLDFKQVGRRRFFGNIIFLGGLSCPALIDKFLSMDFGPSMSLNHWLMLLRMHYPIHFFPSSWSKYDWNSLVTFLCFLFWTLIVDRQSKKKTEIPKILYAIFCAVLVMYLLGIIFTELFPVQVIIELQLLRSSLFLFVVGFPFIVRYLVHKLKSNDLEENIIAAATLGIFFSTNHIFVGAFFLFNIFQDLMEMKIIPKINYAMTIVVTVSLSLIILLPLLKILADISILPPIFYYLSAKVNPPTLLRIIIIPIPVIVFILIKFLRTNLDQSRLLRHHLLNTIIVLLIVFGVYRAISGGWYQKQDPEWKDVQIWCSRYTSTKSLIVTPPELQGFRIYSRRSILGEWTDSWWYHSRTDAQEWWKRMQAYGYVNQIPVGDVRSSTGDDLLNAAKLYQADFIVTTQKIILPLPCLYRNKGFNVYSFSSHLTGI